MYAMFYGASAFDQDLSQWCVSKITSKPKRFDLDSAFEDQDEKQPQWGKCPIGINLAPIYYLLLN